MKDIGRILFKKGAFQDRLHTTLHENLSVLKQILENFRQGTTVSEN